MRTHRSRRSMPEPKTFWRGDIAIEIHHDAIVICTPSGDQLTVDRDDIADLRAAITEVVRRWKQGAPEEGSTT